MVATSTLQRRLFTTSSNKSKLLSVLTYINVFIDKDLILKENRNK